jgi:hypothetical protein
MIVLAGGLCAQSFGPWVFLARLFRRFYANFLGIRFGTPGAPDRNIFRHIFLASGPPAKPLSVRLLDGFLAGPPTHAGDAQLIYGQNLAILDASWRAPTPALLMEKLKIRA